MIKIDKKITSMAKTMLFAGLIMTLIIPAAGINSVSAEEEESSVEIQSFNANAVKNKIDNTGKFKFTFQDEHYTLLLEEFDLRSADSKAFVRDDDGNLMEVEKEDIKTYQGHVKGHVESSAFLLVGENEIVSFIQNENTEITIEPIRDIDQDNSDYTKHSVSESEMLPNFDESIVPVPTAISILMSQLTIPEAQAAGSGTLDVVLDCDRAFYNLGTSNWQSRQLSEIGAITSDLFSQTNISVNVMAAVCDTNNSKYSSSDHDDLWIDVRNEWAGNGQYTNRDTAILFVGKDMDGTTVGFVDLIFDPPVKNTAFGSYAVVQTVNDPSSTFNATPQERKQTLMHEIGHVMGALHSQASILYTSQGVDYWTLMKNGIPYAERTLIFSDATKNEIMSNLGFI